MGFRDDAISAVEEKRRRQEGQRSRERELQRERTKAREEQVLEHALAKFQEWCKRVGVQEAPETTSSFSWRKQGWWDDTPYREVTCLLSWDCEGHSFTGRMGHLYENKRQLTAVDQWLVLSGWNRYYNEGFAVKIRIIDHGEEVELDATYLDQIGEALLREQGS